MERKTTPPSNNHLSIGTFSQATRLSPKALRLYDRANLLKPVAVDADSGYRFYSIGQIEDGRRIRTLREIEMPLARIRQILTADEQTARSLIQTYWSEQEAAIEGGRHIVRSLLHPKTDGGIEMIESVQVRETAPLQIASITQNVKQTQLSAHIGVCVGTLIEWAKANDLAMPNAPFGIYHGMVDENTASPVEVCLPIEGTGTPTGDIVLRELPGGRMATVQVTGIDCRPPYLMKAYDALYDWIDANGFAIAGSPQEEWTHDGESVPPDERRNEIRWAFTEKSAE